MSVKKTGSKKSPTKVSKISSPKPLQAKARKPTTASLTKANTKTKAIPKKAGIKKAEKTGVKSKETPINAKQVSKSTAKEMMQKLCQLYPDADCELTYRNDFELLTSVILSAQTTDVQVNKVSPGLFAKYPTPSALASADPESVKQLIKATGYYNNKAKAIQACASALVKNFNGKVPNTLEDLVTLPGVGRKTANVVLGVVHKIPGWTIDTHVQRLTKRLGMTKNDDPYKIELDLQKLFPEEDWTKYSITLIWHGRRLCYARSPECVSCPLNQICPSSEA